MYISIEQALTVYDELVSCYYEDNHYGTDVCELYTFKLLPYSPSYSQNWTNDKSMSFQDFLEMEKKAATSLKDIVTIFSQSYSCKVFIEDSDTPFNDWYEQVMSGKDRFCHRIHLKVVKNEE